MDETFCDLICDTGIADNLVVYGYNSDFNNHDEKLRAVFQRTRQTGLRFKPWTNVNSGALEFPSLTTS